MQIPFKTDFYKLTDIKALYPNTTREIKVFTTNDLYSDTTQNVITDFDKYEEGIVSNAINSPLVHLIHISVDTITELFTLERVSIN